MKAILTYHSIDSSGSPVSCDPESFERHLCFYSSGRVRVTTLTDLVSLPDDADAIAITFDDAFVNFGEYAAPRLLDRGLPVTAFVVSDHVGGTNAWGGSAERGIPHLPLLAWPRLRALSASGVDLGAHTRTHCDLERVEDDRLEDEVRGCADVMAQETGIRPDTFAYP